MRKDLAWGAGPGSSTLPTITVSACNFTVTSSTWVCICSCSELMPRSFPVIERTASRLTVQIQLFFLFLFFSPFSACASLPEESGNNEQGSDMRSLGVFRNAGHCKERKSF